MKKTLFILGVILFQLNCFSQPAIQWQKTLGGSFDDFGFSIQETADKGYIIAGMTNSTDGDVAGNQGDYDYWIVKLNVKGTIQWQKTMGGSAEDYAFSIQQTADGGYIIAGMTNSIDGDVTGNHGSYDCWIVKLNPTGTIQWQKTLGGSFEDVALSIQQTRDGGYVIAGYSDSTDGDVSGNHGDYDYWIVKLNEIGKIQWQKTLGGTAGDYAFSIQQTTDGGYILAGETASSDEDVSHNNGSYDFWVVKMNATGIIQWQKTFGGSNIDEAQSIQQTADGGYIVSGNTNSADGDVNDYHGSFDYWIVKLNATGAIQWQKALGGIRDDKATSIQQTLDGGYIVAGWTYSTDGDVIRNNGNYDYVGNDYWIVKLTESGTIQWQKALGGFNDDVATSIRQTKDGGYVVAGWTYSTDTSVDENQRSYDYWIVKLDSGSLSTSSFQQEPIVIYPNPAKSTLNIQFPDDVVIDKIIIIDPNGKIIIEQTKNTTQVNTGGLASGMYLIQAISGEKKWQSAFIIE
ncbi:T9SS type A sorting domain-containing protein [Flavobacterium sp. LS2P90]|uniref:T9SS type A sorting domain-containing protein n=1 Tax=Flavobacterium xylosi TaxID=3230415 RepID=A0ABW6HT30_9FLAO